MSNPVTLRSVRRSIAEAVPADVDAAIKVRKLAFESLDGAWARLRGIIEGNEASAPTKLEAIRLILAYSAPPPTSVEAPHIDRGPRDLSKFTLEELRGLQLYLAAVERNRLEGNE